MSLNLLSLSARYWETISESLPRSTVAVVAGAAGVLGAGHGDHAAGGA
jgi:hypothetical protein